jgi:hypothetical protein
MILSNHVQSLPELTEKQTTPLEGYEVSVLKAG